MISLNTQILHITHQNEIPPYSEFCRPFRAMMVVCPMFAYFQNNDLSILHHNMGLHPRLCYGAPLGLNKSRRDVILQAQV